MVVDYCVCVDGFFILCLLPSAYSNGLGIWQVAQGIVPI